MEELEMVTVMMLSTPRSMQGQMVDVSYGWAGGCYYRRSLDRATRTVAWHVADDESTAALAETSYDAGGAIDPPTIDEWTPCAEPVD